jgi:hypothetical protein
MDPEADAAGDEPADEHPATTRLRTARKALAQSFMVLPWMRVGLE